MGARAPDRARTRAARCRRTPWWAMLPCPKVARPACIVNPRSCRLTGTTWSTGVRYNVGVPGYSGTPLPSKLGLRPGMTLALLKAPPGVLAEMPSGVVVKHQARGRADVVVAFFVRRLELERRVGVLGTMVFPDGGLWIAWPKRASGVETDVTDGVVREVALPLGLVDNKVCAIDETWSGLRVVWRRELRPVGP
jgi:hypothetical protein